MTSWELYEILKSGSLSATSTIDIAQMDPLELQEGILEFIDSKQRS